MRANAALAALLLLVLAAGGFAARGFDAEESLEGGRDLVPYWSSAALPTALGECGATRVRPATPSNWERVIGAATGCDRVVLAAGDYGAGTVALDPRGTGVSTPVTIEPAAGASVNIAAAIYMRAARYVRWNGVPGELRFRASSSDYLVTVQTPSSSFVEFRSAIFDMSAQAGGRIQGLLVRSGASNVYVLGNVFRHNPSRSSLDHAIYTGDTTGAVVANNVVRDVRGGYGLHIWGKTQDSWFVHNTIDATGECSGTIGSSTGAQVDGHPAARNTIEANVFLHPGRRDGCDAPWTSYWPGVEPPSGRAANRLARNVSTRAPGHMAGVVESGNAWGVAAGSVGEESRDRGDRNLVDVDFEGRPRDRDSPDAGAFESPD